MNLLKKKAYPAYRRASGKGLSLALPLFSIAEVPAIKILDSPAVTW